MPASCKRRGPPLLQPYKQLCQPMMGFTRKRHDAYAPPAGHATRPSVQFRPLGATSPVAGRRHPASCTSHYLYVPQVACLAGCMAGLQSTLLHGAAMCTRPPQPVQAFCARSDSGSSWPRPRTLPTAAMHLRHRWTTPAAAVAQHLSSWLGLHAPRSSAHWYGAAASSASSAVIAAAAAHGSLQSC